MERGRKRVVVLLIPVVVVFLLVRQQWGVWGRWDFGGMTTVRGVEEEREMVGVNGTLGVSSFGIPSSVLFVSLIGYDGRLEADECSSAP